MHACITSLGRPPLPGPDHAVDDLCQARGRVFDGQPELTLARDLPAQDVVGHHLTLALDLDHATRLDLIGTVLQDLPKEERERGKNMN